jgi:predicted ATPase
MCQGRRLTGPLARQRVVAIIAWLHANHVLTTLAEASALLAAAGMSALDERNSGEADLVRALAPAQPTDQSPPPAAHRPHPSRITHHLSPPTNLPLQVTSFVGRDDEIAAILRLLEGARLLTLVGLGGAGKTRLALRLGTDLLPTFSAGVWFVELAALTDPALVPGAVAQVLGVPEQGGAGTLQAIAANLRDKHLLLILDNCEHIVAPTVDLASALLRLCPRLRILATSREVLRASGEVVWRVRPLTLPDPTHTGTPDPESLLASESVRLFHERAAAVRPGFAITEHNAQAVAAICRRLEGLPLAIELAAARISILPPQAMLARLQAGFSLLEGGPRDRPERHHTIYNTIAWSYDLLSPAEQQLFRCMGIFSGGCTLPAIETVCLPTSAPQTSTASSPSPSPSLFDSLSGLVNKSLVRQDETEGEPRFTMLETVRVFALDRLAEAGEGPRTEYSSTRRRHTSYYLQLAETAAPYLHGPGQVQWLQTLDAEHDNLRAALEWTLSPGGDPPLALRLVAALGPFWIRRSYITEGRTWLQQALSLPLPPPPPPPTPSSPQPQPAPHPTIERVRALLQAGRLALRDGDLQAASSSFQESLALSQLLDYTQGIAEAHYGLGGVAVPRGDHQAMHSSYNLSLSLFSSAGDKHGIARSLFSLADVARIEGRYAASQSQYEQALSLFREAGDTERLAITSLTLAALLGNRGQYARASILNDEALILCSQVGDRWDTALGLKNRGELALAQGEPEAATRHLEESLALFRETGSVSAVTELLCDLGMANLALESYDAAQHHLASAFSLAQTLSSPYFAGIAWRALGHLSHRTSNYHQALARFGRSLEMCREQSDTPGITASLAGIAGVAASQGHSRLSHQLFGALEALLDSQGATVVLPDRFEYQRNMRAARARLTEAQWLQALSTGKSTSLERAVELALQLAAVTQPANEALHP